MTHLFQSRDHRCLQLLPLALPTQALLLERFSLVLQRTRHNSALRDRLQVKGEWRGSHVRRDPFAYTNSRTHANYVLRGRRLQDRLLIHYVDTAILSPSGSRAVNCAQIICHLHSYSWKRHSQRAVLKRNMNRNLNVEHVSLRLGAKHCISHQNKSATNRNNPFFVNRGIR